ncbi:lipopolysaccharide-induced tumor necrosis factor-alpha factor homolog isoform X2 [Galleria mellonella]|uniref:Lipopolysaccharide-induced tumor necrosis factor-alpha factor homolog isoform X2 n=1 Tax=Galleria mellonella TaxID=7137 RepID=A0A6J1WHA7_GALME|nr:lipopolysaccharide-induced tumor necrosis factor-alpha factor homolog isoform X2 [Galleria mellonella]
MSNEPEAKTVIDAQPASERVDDRPISSPPPYPGPPQSEPSVQHVHLIPGTVTVTHPPAVVVIAQQMGPEPAITVCKTCNHQIVTRTDQRPTMRTHLTALLLLLLGCWPCVCVPYCVNSCLAVDHYCTRCGAYIGSYQY